MQDVKSQIEAVINNVISKFRTQIVSVNDDIEMQLLFSEIKEFIYNECYINKLVGCEKGLVVLSEAKEVASIRKTVFNNKSTYQIDKNWTFYEKQVNYKPTSKSFVIWKNGEYRLVPAKGFVMNQSNELGGKKNMNSDYVDIHYEKLKVSDYFYWFRGNNFYGPAFEVRFYFNLDLYKYSGFIKFIANLTDQLNGYMIPFLLKYPSTVTHTRCRADNTVLYVGKEHYFLTYLIISKIHEKSVNYFRNKLPLFVKGFKLKGVGFAESPYRDVSFGKYMSGIVAQTFIKYCSSNEFNDNFAGCTNFVVSKLKSKGHDIDENNIYKNPNSSYPYFFPENTFKDKYSQKRKSIDSKYLGYAVAIGKLLCKNALVIETDNLTYCTWQVVIDKEENACNGKGCQDSYIIVNDDFDSGALGIIHFLAVLSWFINDEPIFRYMSGLALKNIKRTEDNQEQINFICEILEYSDNNATITEPTRISINSLDKEDSLLNDIYRPVSSNIKKSLDSNLNKNFKSDFFTDSFNPVIDKGFSGIGLQLINLHIQEDPMLIKRDARKRKSPFSRNISEQVISSLLTRIQK